MHMYPIDGAAHDLGPSDTAWSYRDARWGSVFAGVDPDPANVDEIRHWTIDYHEALHPYSAGGAYVNMMMDEGQERVRASYRDNYDRLAADQGASTTRTTSSASTRTSSPPHPAHEGAALIPASAGSPAMPLIASDATKVRAPVRR